MASVEEPFQTVCAYRDDARALLANTRFAAAHGDERMPATATKPVLRLLKDMKKALDRLPRRAGQGGAAVVATPCWVVGDVHGNSTDLAAFEACTNGWAVEEGPSPQRRVLFLGDYVDRGTESLAVVLHVALLVTSLPPGSVVPLRGNHEDPDINGWEEHYGATSFLFQCRAKMATPEDGVKVWQAANAAFAAMPLAAVVSNASHTFLAVHGGFPLQLRGRAPVDPSIPQDVKDVLWGDFADLTLSASTARAANLSPHGIGPGRGKGLGTFSDVAASRFLAAHGFTAMLRAHQPAPEGVCVSRSGSVVTVFSTSKDHGSHHQCAAVVWVPADGARLHARHLGPPSAWRRSRARSHSQPRARARARAGARARTPPLPQPQRLGSKRRAPRHSRQRKSR